MCADVLENLGIEKYIGMVGGAAHVEPLHSRLVLQAVVSVLIDQFLYSFQIAFNNGCDMHDVSHDTGLF
jgi:hypothetical protein